MTISEFDTDHLPPAERLEYWQELSWDFTLPSRFDADDPLGFSARARALDLGRVQVFVLHFTSVTVERSPALVRRHDPEITMLWLTADARLDTNRHRQEVTARKGDFVLFDSSWPSRGRVVTDSAASTCVMLQVPRADLPTRVVATGSAQLGAFSSSTGSAALLRNHLHGLVRHSEEFAPAEAAALADATVALMTATLTQVSGAADGRAGAHHKDVLRAAIRAFVDAHLADPALSPAEIARAHHISVRHLHKLFEDEGPTVAERIRAARLDRIRRDLTDPGLADLSVARIGSRWGLTDPARLSRTFRARFGVSPTEHRESAALGRSAP